MIVKTKEVTTRRDLKAFVHYPNALYKDSPYYVPQIESMELNTLTPDKNHAFEVCEGKYWLAYNEKGEIVGRVAGIINRRYNESTGEKACRFGWIDFIDDRDVSKALIDSVEQYAREKGMDMMIGPMGFLEFDTAGILVEGFDKLATAYGKYNAPYYEQHLLDLGYAKDVDYVEYLIKVPEVIPSSTVPQPCRVGALFRRLVPVPQFGLRRTSRLLGAIAQPMRRPQETFCDQHQRRLCLRRP